MSKKGAHGAAASARSAPVVDYVLKFQAVPPRCAAGRGKVPPAETAATADEFRRLLTAIRSVGLAVTTRVGRAGTGTVLVFVCAGSELLEEMHVRENTLGLLSGVYTGACRLPRDAAQARGAVIARNGAVISPADRVRYVHQLLTAHRPRMRRTGARAVLPSGAGLGVRSADYPHLVDMMPLHDRTFDKRWMSAWTTVSLTSVLFGIRDEDLDELRFFFGGSTAMYFAFLNTYFTTLFPVAVLGAAFWAASHSFDGVYAAVLVVWCCTFTEGWRIREQKLAVRWGIAGASKMDVRNPSFRPRAVCTDPVTGEDVEIFEWWRRQVRTAFILPVVLLFAVVLVGALTLIFAIEIITAEVYDGPFKSVVPLIPTVLFSTCIPLILSVWQTTARSLARWQNHATERAYEASLMLKMFGMQSLVTYGGLVLTAFVYIPFGEGIVRHISEQGWVSRAAQLIARDPSLHIALRPDFHVHPGRLRDQLFALCVTAQVTNTATETLVPIVLRTAVRWKNALARLFARAPRAAREPQRVSFAADAVEREFMDHVEAEFGLATYDTFVDYAEMATQFGSIALWSVIWPLAPVMGFINNWFELRSDALKLCVNMRRPVPVRAESIGSWNNVLSTITRLAAFTNAALVYLFEDRVVSDGGGRAVSVTTLRPSFAASACEKLDGLARGLTGTSVPSFLPRSGPAGALAAAFVVGLLSEHAFGIVRAAVAYVFEHVAWDGCDEDTALRRSQYESRVSIVDQLERARASDTIAIPAPRARVHKDQSFWDPAHDDGLAYILRSGKAE